MPNNQGYVPEYINRQLAIFDDSSKPRLFRNDALFRLASHLDIDLDPNDYTFSEKEVVINKAKQYQ